MSRSSTANTNASSSLPSADTEDGSYIVVGNGKVGSSPLKQQMSANPSANNLSTSAKTGKIGVPSAWKKKGGNGSGNANGGGRGREVSGAGSLNGGTGGGGEESSETASIASSSAGGGVLGGGGVSMSRGIAVGSGSGSRERS